MCLRRGADPGENTGGLGAFDSANKGVVMQDYQRRVVTERRELSEKMDKLEQFLLGDAYLNLPGAEQNRLVRQVLIMSDYRDVLDERIAAFGV
jgi:hypothetical protein